jgi:hypothetical protein
MRILLGYACILYFLDKIRPLTIVHFVLGSAMGEQCSISGEFRREKLVSSLRGDFVIGEPLLSRRCGGYWPDRWIVEIL